VTKRIYILFVTTLINSVVFGQFIGRDDVSISLFYLQQSKLDSAKKYIDRATLDKELSTTVKTWYYKGAIYKDLYKKQEKTDKASSARLEAIEALKKAIRLGAEKDFLKSSLNSLSYLSSTLYNDAARLLNISEYDQARKNYNEYRNVQIFMDPSIDLKSKDIPFKMALASMLEKTSSNQGKLSQNQMEKIASIVLEVLEIDSNHSEANFYLGSLYYNAGADIINNLDYDIDLVNLYKAQDDCAILFLKALPYMKKSYKFNYKRERTLIGLSNIYYGLNDSEKFEAYKKELQDLENDK